MPQPRGRWVGGRRPASGGDASPHVAAVDCPQLVGAVPVTPELPEADAPDEPVGPASFDEPVAPDEPEVPDEPVAPVLAVEPVNGESPCSARYCA